MSLYQRMKAGNPPELRWLFCEPCQQEWLAPLIPDATPKFCTHCGRPIDPTLQPGKVLEDVEPEPHRDELYYHSSEAHQHSTFEMAADAQVRIQPVTEIVCVGDKEYLAVGQEITILANPWTSVAFRMSHHGYHKFVTNLVDYLTTCSSILDHGHSLVGARLLKTFGEYMPIGDQKRHG